MADHFSAVVNLMDDSFSLRETRNWGLAISLGDTTFTCCILDYKRNKFIGLQQFARNEVRQLNSLSTGKGTYPEFLNSIIEELPWLKSSFRHVKIAWEGRKSTLIPAPLFDPDEKENYFKFSFLPAGEEVVSADHLLSMDSFQVFTIPAIIKQSVNEHFQDTQMVHAGSVLIESIWINYKNRISAPRVFLHLRPGLFDLMIFDGRQMTYFNTFPYQNPEDITYYVIFVLEQLNFNPETIPLILLGNVDKGEELAELLFRYVRYVEFGRRNNAYKYSYVLNQLPPHAHYPLFNFFSCGL